MDYLRINYNLFDLLRVLNLNNLIQTHENFEIFIFRRNNLELQSALI